MLVRSRSLIGVGGALLLAFLVIIQKHIVRDVNPIGLAFWIDVFAVIALLPVLPFAGRVLPSPSELGFLLIVGVVFTALSGLIWLLLLRHVTAQAMGFLSYHRARLGIASGLADPRPVAGLRRRRRRGARSGRRARWSFSASRPRPRSARWRDCRNRESRQRKL